MPKTARRHFLVRVDGIEGTFMTMTGGTPSADVTKMYDGGEVQPENIPGPPQADDVVISRGWDPYRDSPIVSALRQQVGSFTATVSKTPTDRDMTPVGDPEVYPEALLRQVVSPEADASSGDGAVFELTFAIAGWV